MDLLERHYTEANFSKLLIESIKFNDPISILDLGIGAGSLTEAAYCKWSSAVYWGFDIDTNQLKYTSEKLPFVNIISANGLEFINKFPFKVGSIDIAICNPPYFRLANKKDYAELFKSVNLSDINSFPYITADLVFLAKNLLSLKIGGQLGIILPDGLITSQAFVEFRKSLITNYTIKSLIELPSNVFKKTEAKTHILILEKIKPKEEYLISLSKADVHGKCIDSIEVLSDQLYERLDFSFVSWSIRHNNLDAMTLNMLGCEIIRSSRSVKYLKELKVNFLHTTNFKNGEILNISIEIDSTSDGIYAIDGDIVVARVGRRCIGKTALVMTGRIRISDCLFIIRATPAYRMQIFHELSSKRGQDWFRSTAHGVCSQVISRSNLYSFPI